MSNNNYGQQPYGGYNPNQQYRPRGPNQGYNQNQGQYNNMNNQFGQMGFNPNAQSFNPNPNANTFVPGGGGGYQPRQTGYSPGPSQGYHPQHQNNQANYQNQQSYQQPPQQQYQQRQEPLKQSEPADDWDDEVEDIPTPVVEEVKVVTPEPVVEKPKVVEEPVKEEIKPVVSVKPVEEPPKVSTPEPETLKSDKKKEEPKQQTFAKKTMKSDKKLEAKDIRKSNKEHLNVVFIGHVDAGKSTIGGQIMKLTNMVDTRTLEKFEREAKEKNRESWYLSWALDTNLEERDKGKTVECGRAFFETENKHFTILDAPVHKSFVPNMISGASQADIAVLVISARRGEFEAGFELGGQTREHAMLVKTAGVRKLIVVINKMDEQTVQWSKERYDEIKGKLSPFLKKTGYKPKEVQILPVSGQTGINVLESRPDLHPWYKGLPLIGFLDSLPPVERTSSEDDPVRMPIVGKYKDMGVIAIGKLESGQIMRGQTYTMMPNKQMVKVTQILSDDTEVDFALAGENLKLKLDGIEEEDILGGFVLCSNNSLCHYSNTFDAKLRILEYKSIMAPGFQSILHIHTVTEEVKITHLICKINTKTGEKERFQKGKAKFLQEGDLAIVRLQTSGNICLEKFSDFDRMGRMTLRDEGKTIGMGTIMKIVD